MSASIDHHAVMAQLSKLDGAYDVSPLVDLDGLAKPLGLAALHAKDESSRPLHSFKSLGGTYAGLRAAEAIGAGLRSLVCASDGNHGLAVAFAARHLGVPAYIYLHEGVSGDRIDRIESIGGTISIVPGTFDDAVDRAAEAAHADGAILIADTSDDPDDLVTADVMTGYGIIAGETREQFTSRNLPRPTHLFIQAGVGGLAAAMARGLHGWMEQPARVVVVEPESAACVGRALETGKPERIAGTLETCATMLSCGQASAPALAVLLECGARAMTVDENALYDAPGLLMQHSDIKSTPSGTAGLAGLVAALHDADLRAAFQIDSESRVLLVVSEGLPQD